MSFIEKLKPSRQKKLLALDGGGIRGVITLEILAKLEQIVQNQLGQGAVLADYFDYVAGTSTGAIIATCIALGKSVTEIKSFYLESGREMFSRAGLLRRIYTKYEDTKLAGQLRAIMGSQTTLGSDQLRTLLMMVMRNATTDSPWPLCNNPRAKYNLISEAEGCNLKLPLWQLVRASTAAPTYFPPEPIRVGDKDFLFVDGGVTMYNNPAFQLFLMATAAPYNLCWPTGKDKMLLVSVGTGTSPMANANLQADDMNLLYNAGAIPSALMYAALNEQDFLCRVFGETRAGCILDREIGDMKGVAGAAMPKLFTYMRYNTELSDEGFRQLGITAFRPDAVQALDSVDHIEQLQEVGRAVAEAEVKASHFSDFQTT
jgi:hypothetical protein